MRITGTGLASVEFFSFDVASGVSGSNFELQVFDRTVRPEGRNRREEPDDNPIRYTSVSWRLLFLRWKDWDRFARCLQSLHLH